MLPRPGTALRLTDHSPHGAFMTATHSVGRPPPAVDLMPAYRPGKGAAQAEAEHGISNAIKLASNENPLPPIQSIVYAVPAAATGANRYADHRPTPARERLSEW